MSSRSLGPVVEGRHRRQHDGAHLGQGQQALEMAEVQRRLAHEHDERPPLLERDVGRPGDQGLGVAGGDGGRGLDAAGGDDHAAVRKEPEAMEAPMSLLS